LAGAAGITAASIVAGCGDDGATGSPGSSTTNATSSTTNATSSTTNATSGGAAATTRSSSLAKTSEIPVGGGKIMAGKDVVIPQPTAGQYRAFSAPCTHQGCPVSSVTDGTINCPCHGSRYSAADGSVKNGPAEVALAARQIKVSGDDITLA